MLHYLRQTKTQTGLQVQAHLVVESYAIGERVPDKVMATLDIQAHQVCPQWNYTIRPRTLPTAGVGWMNLFFYEP